MNLSGIAPFLGFASQLIGGAAAPNGSGAASGSASSDPFSAIIAFTQQADTLATGGGFGLLPGSLGGGSLLGSVSGFLA